MLHVSRYTQQVSNRWILAFSLGLILMILLTALAHFFTHSTQSGLPECDYVQISDHPSSLQIKSITESPDGYIWLGTERGINRYDGEEYLQFYCTADTLSLPNQDIMGLDVSAYHPGWMLVSSYNSCSLLRPDGRSLMIQPGLSILCELDEQTILATQVLSGSLSSYHFDADAPALSLQQTLQVGTYIHGVYPAPDSTFWIVTRNTIEQYDRQFCHKSRIAVGSIHGYLLPIGKQEVWMLMDDGYQSLDLKNGTVRSTPQTEFVNAHIERYSNVYRSYYSHGLLAVRESDLPVLTVFDLEQMTVRYEDLGDLGDTELGAAFWDSHHNLWLGSRSLGFRTQFARRAFFADNGQLCRFFADKDITSLVQSPDGTLWILTGRSRLYVCNANNEIQEVNLENLPTSNLMHLASMRNGHLLISASNLILDCYIDAQAHLKVARQIASSSSIYAFMEDPSGRIWTGTQDGLFVLDQGQLSLVPSRLKGINVIHQLSDGRILCGSLVHGLSIIQPETLAEIHYDLPLDKEGMFSCRDVAEDSDHGLWVATNGMGIHHVDLTTHEVVNYRAPNMCTDVSCLLADPMSHDVWMGTLNGLSKLDPQTGQFQTFYDVDGVQGNEFFEKCAVTGPQGQMIFGGKRGLTVFNPAQIEVKMSHELKISAVEVEGHVLFPGFKSQDYAFSTSDDSRLTLPHDFSNLRLHLTALNFGDYARPHLEYRLRGYETDWSFATQPSVNYSLLDPGSYRFEVRSLDPTGQVIATCSLPITVSYPWWKVWWLRWLCYPLLLLCLILLFIRWRQSVLYRQRRIRIALREKVALKYVSEMNMRFFTNMSHEFRTPLTLIKGALGLLPSESLPDGEGRHALSIIQHNTQRMVRLVNQLLDFKKLEHDMLKLRVQPFLLNGTVSSVLEMFQSGFMEKGIGLEVKSQGLAQPLWIDVEKYENVVVNLLSNAMKFTPRGGRVTWTVRPVNASEAASAMSMKTGELTEGSWLYTEVSDTGIGIQDDKLEAIFERFYQTAEGEAQHSSTGIGLYFCRGLVRLHHGHIIARHNREASSGTTFAFVIPVGQGIYSAEERADGLNTETQEPTPVTPTPTQTEVTETTEEETTDQIRPTVLVVDDDTEVLNFMRLILKPHFEVITETSATETISALPSLKPDLIISDVMMLGMDGYKFCQLLKEDVAYCHIPVILLTAKVSLEERVQGLSVGADAYVTKPFEPAYLLALIQNLLDNRHRLQQLLSSSAGALGSTTPDSEKEKKPQLSPQDAAFIDKFYGFMEQHLSDAELDLEQLLVIVGMSRSKLFYKVKGLTGQTPNAFFRIYKLNRAAEMIRQGDLKLAYIAELTGFCGPSHFSQNFKKQFGVLPSEYK